MKVIFIKDLKKIAKQGDIKEVKDGYAENYLIKNGYAVIYNDKNISTLNKQKKNQEHEDEILRKDAEILKKTIEKLNLVFKVKAGKDDKVFGSISPKQIKEELSKKGYNFDKKQLSLITSLQTLGFHKIEIILYKDIKAELKVQLTK